MKKFRKLLSVFLSITMLSLMIHPTSIQAARYEWLDLTRIHGSKTGKVYKAEATFGPLIAPGSLRYTGEFSIEEIENAVDEIFQQNGIDESDIKYAESLMEKWKKEVEITTDEAIEVGLNIASIMGVDTPLQVANEVYKFVKDGQTGWDAVQNLAKQAVEGRKDDIVFAAQRAVAVSLLTGDHKALREAGTILYKYLNAKDDFFADTIKIGMLSTSYKGLFEMVLKTVNLSYQQWKADKERWKTRVDATKANAFLTSFYDAVNKYLTYQNPSQNWVLNVGGGQKRLFTFYGAENNIQYLSMGMIGVKDKLPASYYVFRGDRTNYPYGVYTGSASISISHDLSVFDALFWNLPIGILKKNWLNDLLIAAGYAGGGELYQENSTSIYRHLSVSNIKFYIPGGYSEQYSANIPRTVGNRDVTTTIPLSEFKDEVKVNATHLLDYKWGLANIQDGDKITAYDEVKLAAHAVMDNGSLQLIFDNTEAFVWIAGTTFADVDMDNTDAGGGWDNNIWAGMDSGLKVTIHLR